MKILSIIGSPRKAGNTAKVLNWVEDEFRKQGHNVQRVDVGDGKMKGCIECFACKKTPDKPACTLKDEGNAIFERMLDSELVLFASPVFCWGVTAQLKAVFDRAYCLLKFEDNGYRSLVKGRRLALLITGGGEIKDNLELTVPPFEQFTQFFGCSVAGTLLLPGCDQPEKLNPALEDQARAFARTAVKAAARA